MNSFIQSERLIYYQILPVTLINGDRKVKTYAFCDAGSSVSLVRNDIVRQLNVVGVKETMKIAWTNGEIHEEDSMTVKLKIQGASDEIFSLFDLQTVDELKLPTQSVNSSALAKQYPYLKDIELQSYEEAVPTILLGLPHAYLFKSQGEISGRFNDPIVRNTPLGLIIYGNSKEYRHENVRANINFVGGINRLTGSIRGGKRRQKTKSNKGSVKLEKPDAERTQV